MVPAADVCPEVCPEKEAARRRARRAALMLLLLALALHAWEARERQPQIDDAYISYRYARNLARGDGLVFNSGERVEGYTNMMWTLMLAAGEALGVDGPHTAHVLGFLSGGALLLLTWLWVRERVAPERAWLAGLAACALWASSAFAAWTFSGLETALFAALVLAAFWAQARSRIGWATMAVVLATWTRPEGVLAACALFGAELWPWLARPRSIFERRERWLPPLLYAAVLALQTLFRLGYYGELLPNTFYAKVGSVPIGRGVLYLLAFLFDGSLWLFMPIAKELRVRMRGEGVLGALRSRRPWADCAFVTLLFVYVVLVGGDVFLHSRFLLPAIPFLLGAACAGVDAAFERGREAGRVQLVLLVASIVWPLYLLESLAVISAALLVALCLLPRVRRRLRPAPVLASFVGLVTVATCAAPLHRWSQGFSKIRVRRLRSESTLLGSKRRALAKIPNFLADAQVVRQVERMRALDPPVHLVAHTAIGRFGYWSNFPILDLLGLVDAHIARAGTSHGPDAGSHDIVPRGAFLPGHQRSDSDYVLARRPDLIVIPKRNEKIAYGQLPAIIDLWDDPRLDRDYRWAPALQAYERRDRGERGQSITAERAH